MAPTGGLLANLGFVLLATYRVDPQQLTAAQEEVAPTRGRKRRARGQRKGKKTKPRQLLYFTFCSTQHRLSPLIPHLTHDP
jgi:hypothetical protein